MKYIKFFSSILLIISLLIVSCQDRLQDEFKSPESHNPRPEEIVPGMFTQMLTTRYFVLDYNEWWNTLGSSYVGLQNYIQVAVRRPHPSESGTFTSNWPNLSGNALLSGNNASPRRVREYYTDLKNYALIRDELESVSGKDLYDNELYYILANVIKNSIGLQVVDIFDRIQYTEAFQGTKGVFFPKYDYGIDIYYQALDELKELADKIVPAYTQMSDNAKSTFATQDIAMGGDPQKWVQYVNAVRLKHAVRLSGVDLQFAQAHIQDVIGKLPTEDFTYKSNRRNPHYPGVNTNAAGGTDFTRAMYEQPVTWLIPNIIMNRMNRGNSIDYVEGEDDPRLPVIANPVRYSATGDLQYVGVSMDYATQYEYWPVNLPAGTPAPPNIPGTNIPFDAGEGLTFRTFENSPINVHTHWMRNAYSTYNLATYWFNQMPVYMNSLAENDLFLAEIALKGIASTGKSAADHVYDAVMNSTDFWYMFNSHNTFYSGSYINSNDDYKRIFAPDKPSNAVIAQFANIIKADFEAAATLDDKMEIIMQQKYIHLNIIGIYELWAELRRTRLPKIEKLDVGDGTVYAIHIERSRYPASELILNPEQFQAVFDDNNMTKHIFWVPENKRTESYYRNDYLPLKGFLPLPTPNPNRPRPGSDSSTPVAVAWPDVLPTP
jgi:hypothetical protein